MTEEQRNENIIRSKIQCICQDCMYLDKIVPILNKMQNETWIDGLEQGKFDKEMDTMYNNTKKSRLTNTTKENNQYYEPTIKTSRNEYKKIKEQFGIDKDLYDALIKCLCNPKNEYISKQNIIDFLEDKIKQNEKRQEQFCYEEPGYSYCEGIDDVLEEVLDFVRGGKDE